ncbi:3'(2'),5'-bisphosphate nucleotidase CysQ [Oceanomicrobium pacificus]|uniref:3'(2'),5'-bisphosphate nucleotidase CysQ n=1 Tax=Oceanomicrobium pacificus TaxID=2692916 RepID=A0A6B0TQ75_9RHOB|nr:3'(2'),5'-bisphosphate nucleotidase CysQ [Oceanomicrobium pacificus]MXU64839.1 3'(2'),5'-bisphosphate nucleotidase CysQ [Oceanomicrobium pacificus]
MPARDLDLLTEAALAAGEIAKRHFRSGPEVWDKGGGLGPVTQADLEIDRMLQRDLTAARPDYGWLSEETPDTPERLSREAVFIIDPIDGTRAFIDGQTSFSHSLAIVRNGHVSAAVVHLPLEGLTYAAAAGQGATLNGAPLAPPRKDSLAGARLLVNKAQMKDLHWTGGVPDVEQMFRPSLAYRLCLAAEGAADAMLTLRDAWEWDIAAGALIAAEAGLDVQDRSGAPLSFNGPTRLLPGVIVAPAALASALLAHGPRPIPSAQTH